MLRTYPLLNIWHAGCATGEEAYSTAVLLREEGVYDRCQIYATDLSTPALERAKQGVFATKDRAAVDERYRRAGGAGALEHHATIAYDQIAFHEAVRSRIVFFQHDLVTDYVFAEMYRQVEHDVSGEDVVGDDRAGRSALRTADGRRSGRSDRRVALERAGGALEHHATIAYDQIAFHEAVRSRIVFFQHDLVTDYVFAEMHVVFCRNVLIYFGRELRGRVLDKLERSLCHGGFLCLGTSERLPSGERPAFVELTPERIYRLRGEP